MRTPLGQLHARVIAKAEGTMQAQLRSIAIACLTRLYDSTGNLDAYLDMEDLAYD